MQLCILIIKNNKSLYVQLVDILSFDILPLVAPIL
jgi:hypothetical protein